MATTAAGTPYVEASDLVAGYPAVSLALANHIDTIGKVLQVVRVTDTTDRTTTSTSFIDAFLSVTITPEKVDSDILLIYTQSFQSGSNINLFLQITNAANTGISGAESSAYRTNGGYFQANETVIGYDSPATLSATTYKARYKVGGGTGYFSNGSNTGQLYAIEVAA
jgi:hypothetical protein